MGCPDFSSLTQHLVSCLLLGCPNSVCPDEVTIETCIHVLVMCFLNCVVSYLRFEQSESLHLDFKGLSQQLKEIHDRYKDSCQHIFLRPVKTILLLVSVCVV